MCVAKTIEDSADSGDDFDAALDSGIEEPGTTVDTIRSAWIKDQVVLMEKTARSGAAACT